MDEDIRGMDFGVEPELVFDEKAISGSIGSRIGGGLRKPPPGMVFVDVTGAIDGDADGIVFEGTPFQRPIIPRMTIPVSEARRREASGLSEAIGREEQRRFNAPAGSASRTGGGKKKPGKQRKLTPEELRIQQEQKLRARTIPKKKKPGPDRGEWGPDGSASRTTSPNPRITKLVDDYLDIYPPVGSYARTGGRGGKPYPKKSRDEKLGELTTFLAETLIAALENAKDGKWIRPWRDFGSNRNGKTGKPYRGTNQAILAMVAEERGYAKSIWLTYKQAQELGGQVRKGEKGTMLAYYSRKDVSKIGPDGELVEKSIPLASFFTVFNIDQIDGIDPDRFPEPEVLPEEQRIEAIQAIIEELGVSWNEGGDRAYNSPSDDRVQMPPFGSFDSPEAFYATLMHEVVHWTGNPGRLNRPKMNRFGSAEYAYEELIAEIGSSILMAVLGLEERPDDQHVTYIASWLRRLKDDPKEVTRATAEAQKAVDWLINNSPTLKKLFDDYYPPFPDTEDGDEEIDASGPDVGDLGAEVADGAVDGDVRPQDSTNSWDYDGFGIPGSRSSTRPQYPRKPPAPAFSGRAAEMLDGVKSWDEFWERMGEEEIVFIDYETTGLVFDEFNEPSSNGLPTQIGAVRMKGGKVIDRFNIYINPGIPHSEWEQWSRDNLKDQDGNPITQAFLDDKPSIAEAHRMFVEWAGQGVILGMQNAVFDNEVLEDALTESGIDWRPDGILDTKEIADATLPKWTPENQDAPYRVDKKTGEKKPSNGLADITKYLGVSLGEKHHTADFDAAATGEVLTRIVAGAIEKGWPTDALDPEKRRQKEEAKQRKFEDDIRLFNEAKKQWLLEQEAENAINEGQAETISLDFRPPGSMSRTRNWGISATARSESSPRRRDAYHVDVERLMEGDALPENWDAPSLPLGDPKWQVRSIRRNTDGTLSVKLSDINGQDGDIDVVFDSGARVPNVSRGLRLNAEFPSSDTERDEITPKPQSQRKITPWNSQEATFRRNASADSTEFSLLDEDLPLRRSLFPSSIFSRGELRNEETNKLTLSKNAYTIDSVEDAMRRIADTARGNGSYGREDAEFDLASLRRDIRFSGFLENLDKNIIEDLYEGTYTGSSYSQLNDLMRRRGAVSAKDILPIAYPQTIIGSMSTTRRDLSEPLPVGEIVRLEGMPAELGGFWRADFEESLMADSEYTQSYDPRVVRNIILASRLPEMSIDELVDLAMQSQKVKVNRETWAARFEKLIMGAPGNPSRWSAHMIDNGNIIFINTNGTAHFVLNRNDDGTYEEFATTGSLDAMWQARSKVNYGSIIRYFEDLPNRYKNLLAKARAMYGPHLIGFAQSANHWTLWIVDDGGRIVSAKYAGASGSPGRSDEQYIAKHLLSPVTAQRFALRRGILSANPEYIYSLSPYISPKPAQMPTEDIVWNRYEPLLRPELRKNLIWQLDIPLDRNRRPSTTAELDTNVRIDIYEMPQPDGSKKYRVYGQAIVARGDITEIEVDFDDENSAIAYAMSEASPYPYHAWAMNLEAIETRLPDGVDEKLILDDDIRKLIQGDRAFSQIIGLQGSRSQTGMRIYWDSHRTAENYILDTDSDDSDQRFDAFIGELARVNEQSRELVQKLEEELAKDNPSDEVVGAIERAMKVHDLITTAVADSIFATASRSRQWRVRSAALRVALQLLRNDVESGNNNLRKDDVLAIVSSLENDAADLFGNITTQRVTSRIQKALSALESINWPDQMVYGLDGEDELTPDDIQRLINNPTEEILAAARQALDLEELKINTHRRRTRRDVMSEIEEDDSVSGYRPLLLGDPINGSKSRTQNTSYVNGRMLGDSRVIYPDPTGVKESGAVEFVYYDGAREELVVRFTGGAGEYIYGGINSGLADKIERGKNYGRAINSLVKDGKYSYLIKPNGDTEGTPTTLSQFLERDIENLLAYSNIDDYNARNILTYAKSLEKNGAAITREYPDALEDAIRRIWIVASRVSQVNGEHAAADNILELLNRIDEFRSSGLAGRVSTRNRMPIKEQTLINLNSDELGEIRQELRQILAAHGDDRDIGSLARFDELIRDAQANNSPVSLKRSEHEQFAIAYDKLFAKAMNGETESRFGRTVGESILNLSAHVGKYDSPRLESGGGFRGRPSNSGAPSVFNTANLIGWARRQTSFRAVQSLVGKFDKNDGILTASEWRRLATYHDNSLRRNSGRVYSPPGSFSSTKIPGSASRSDEPSSADLEQIESGSVPKKKRKPAPEGKSIQDIFGDRLDGLTPEEQIDAIFEVGVATRQNEDGINPSEFEARVRELENQRVAILLMEQEESKRQAMQEAVRNGEEFNEARWYEEFSRDAARRREAVVDNYMRMLIDGTPDERARAERFLGVTREEWLARSAERERLAQLQIEQEAEQAKKSLTPTSMPISQLVKKLKAISAKRSADLQASSDYDAEDHREVWDTILSLLEEFDQPERNIPPDIILDQIADLLDDYRMTIFNSADPDRSSGGPGRDGRRSINQAKKWSDIIRNSLDSVESEEDDGDDGDDGIDNGGDLPSGSRSSTLYRGSSDVIEDDFPEIGESYKKIIADGLYWWVEPDNPLGISFELPGQDGAMSIVIGTGMRARRYRRRRPYWRNASTRDLSALSNLTDKELIDALRALSSRRFDPAYLEPLDERPPYRRLLSGMRRPNIDFSPAFTFDEQDPGRGRNRDRNNKHKLDDLLAELEARGYYVYQNDDRFDSSEEWLVVSKKEPTPEEISRRTNGRWQTSSDVSVPPSERVDSDGEREIGPVDLVRDIIETDGLGINEDAARDLIDNSDIESMTLDEVNAELISLRDELEDLRRRANNGLISRAEYNDRRRELNRRKNMLLQRKHGGKDGQSSRAGDKSKTNVTVGDTTVNNSGSTNINVSGNNNTVINSGSPRTTVIPTRKAPRKLRTSLTATGVDELQILDRSRASLRGIDSPIKGSRSSTGDGAAKIEYYKREFGFTGEDFEEIVHGIGSEELLKSKFGISDDDILSIRNNWASAIGIGDISRSRGMSDKDITFMMDYDLLISEAEDEIRDYRKDSENEIARIIKQYDDSMRAELADASLKSTGSDDAADIRKNITESFQERMQVAIRRVEKELRSDIRRSMNRAREKAAQLFLSTFNTEEDPLSAGMVVDVLMREGGIPDWTSRYLQFYGLSDDFSKTVLTEMMKRLDTKFRSGKSIADILSDFGYEPDQYSEGYGSTIIRNLEHSTFIPMILGTLGEQFREEDRQPSGVKDDQRLEEIRNLNPDDMRFVSLGAVLGPDRMAGPPLLDYIVAKVYMDSLVGAYHAIATSGHPQLAPRDEKRELPSGLLLEPFVSSELRQMFINAMSGTYRSMEALYAGADSPDTQLPPILSLLTALSRIFPDSSMAVMQQILDSPRDQILDRISQQVFRPLGDKLTRMQLFSILEELFDTGLSLEEVSRISSIPESTIAKMLVASPDYSDLRKIITINEQLDELYELAKWDDTLRLDDDRIEKRALEMGIYEYVMFEPGVVPTGKNIKKRLEYLLTPSKRYEKYSGLFAGFMALRKAGLSNQEIADITGEGILLINDIFRIMGADAPGSTQ